MMPVLEKEDKQHKYVFQMVSLFNLWEVVLLNFLDTFVRPQITQGGDTADYLFAAKTDKLKDEWFDCFSGAVAHHRKNRK